MKKIFSLLTLILLNSSYSQEIYLNTKINDIETLIKVNLETCEHSFIYTCPHNGGLAYTPGYFDIAIDNSENIYWASNEGLYKRNLNDVNSCEFLGDTMTGNALVADSQNVYGADGHYLFKYNIASGTFESLGNIGYDYYSDGDLFFYENRLFLSVSYDTLDYIAHGLLEINLSNPTESYIFMEVDYGMMNTFSVNYGSYSKVYYIEQEGDYILKVKEIDMVNHIVIDTGCQMIFTDEIQGIFGGASPYEFTQGGLNNPIYFENKLYFNTNNPVSGRIEISTNIEKSDMDQINLLDILGQKVKTFNEIDNLDVSGISAGYYILELGCTDGKKFAQKIIIE